LAFYFFSGRFTARRQAFGISMVRTVPGLVLNISHRLYVLQSGDAIVDTLQRVHQFSPFLVTDPSENDCPCCFCDAAFLSVKHQGTPYPTAATFGVLILSASEFFAYCPDQVITCADATRFRTTSIAELLASFGKTNVLLLVMGVAEFKSRTIRQQNIRLAAVAAGNAPPEAIVTAARTELESAFVLALSLLPSRVSVFFPETASDAALAITLGVRRACFPPQIALEAARDRTYRARRSVAVAERRSLTGCYQTFLISRPRVSPPIAATIISLYPSLPALIDAAEAQGPGFLSETLVAFPRGKRRIGPALSENIWRAVTS
jgi:hypothetical protein